MNDQRRRQPALLKPLKPQELAVLHLLARGKTTREMTDELDCSRYAITANTRRLYAKLGVTTCSEALERAQALGLLEW